METLDLRSVGITLSVCGVALTAVLWAAQRDAKDIDGLNLWIASAITMSAGLGLSALLGWAPEWAARMLGNTLLSTAPVLVWQGARAFHGKPASCWPALAVAIWMLVWSAITLYVWPSAKWRIISASFTIALGCVLAGNEFLRTRERHLRLGARFGGVTLVAFGIVMTVRAIDAWLRPEAELQTALTATTVNVAAYLVGGVVLLSAIAGMVMSVTATRAAEIRDLAYRDLLTSVLSRRGLYAQLPAWLNQHGLGATVIVLDANGFKRVNDMLGHETGDRILQALALSCTRSLPSEALVARFGGDEFVALTPAHGNTDENLSAIAAAFRDQSATILGDTSAPLPTVAIGRAKLGGTTAHDFAAALREADAAMYEQKTLQREGT